MDVCTSNDFGDSRGRWREYTENVSAADSDGERLVSPHRVRFSSISSKSFNLFEKALHSTRQAFFIRWRENTENDSTADSHKDGQVFPIGLDCVVNSSLLLKQIAFY